MVTRSAGRPRSEEARRAILEAAVRLIEYAPYREIIRQLGYRGIVEGWHEWRPYVRSPGVRRGLDFLVEWLPKHHGELL